MHCYACIFKLHLNLKAYGKLYAGMKRAESVTGKDSLLKTVHEDQMCYAGTAKTLARVCLHWAHLSTIPVLSVSFIIICVY